MVDSESAASAKIMQKIPYVFMPSAAEPTVDLPWFYQSLASGAKRTTGSTTPIPFIAIEDGERENSIILKVEEVEQVQYLGREKVRIVNQDILAHKFQALNQDGGTAADLFLMSDSGLILQVIRSAGVKYVLTSYQGPTIQ
jgi:hypothetical protein